MNAATNKSIKLSLVVAINNADRGIGYKGKLPWRIPKDLKHFQKVTTTTVDPLKMNAVIMGRLTWLSIPKMARPLPKRINVIVSSTLKDIRDCQANENADLDSIILCKSFDEAVNVLNTQYANKIETMYAIGGSSIYREALSLPSNILDRIYLTRVYSTDTQCDVFMEPANFLDSFEKLTTDSLAGNIYEAQFNVTIQEPANDLEYVFEVYKKKENP